MTESTQSPTNFLRTELGSVFSVIYSCLVRARRFDPIYTNYAGIYCEKSKVWSKKGEKKFKPKSGY